jgi:hypothetical protein
MAELASHISAEIYEVEVRGTCVEGSDKAAYEQVRLLHRLWADTWTERTARLFAADCARLAANRFADVNQRALIHATIDTVIGFADGRVDDAAESAAESAAGSAAWSAARSAAESAARSAARSEQGDILLRYLNGEEGPFIEEES